MTDSWEVRAFRAALAAVSTGDPRNLVARAQPDAMDRGESLTSADLTRLLSQVDGADPFMSSLGPQVQRWDVSPVSASWTQGSMPSSTERRERICELLGIDAQGIELLYELRPIFTPGTTVISGPWQRWYSAERANERNFYWSHYQDYLLNTKGWPEASVTSLDAASTQVIERLADPTRDTAFQSKGLVVGYVQSGKTANFTGVIAKAIDVGYRLVIVMTGTIELLRSQTQRRIDMEMVGRQNILADLSEDQALESGIDYMDDVDWLGGKFLDLGSTELITEIRRLTQHHLDYKKQFRTLKVERVEFGQPLWKPQNLFRTDARLAVVKKNAAVLRKLVNDIKANKNAFAEIPVLIIDDESDQASVNTVDPAKVRRAQAEGGEIKKRRAINEQIAAMLELMPRAQYVGYTATPFANVFVDPADEQGIFPKDFVIGLPRPNGYMGVDDFHDFLEPGSEPVVPSNEHSYVRSLTALDDDEDGQRIELAAALDMFVLTGAVKLFRSATQPDLKYRHHTMLVHQSVRTAEHSDLAVLVRDLWASGGYSSPQGKRRLRDLYDEDVLFVSASRAEPDVPPMPSFDDLQRYIAKAIARITEYDGNPVIVVNSDRDIDQQQLDFDRHSTWRILIGGAKLSRGFTVEGLTVTYFSRATNMNDSLTQMGRWFGFRHGYRDLVRLYIARNAKFGRKTVDLYEAFESIALDEAAFRRELQKYAEWDGNSDPILPRQIPPLVQQHLPWLRPTAKNKMFNAVLVEQAKQPFSPSGFADSLQDLQSTLNSWRPLLAAAQLELSLPTGDGNRSFRAYVGSVPAEALLAAIRHTMYLAQYFETTVEPVLTYYEGLVENGMLKDFLVVLPQPGSSSVDIGGVGMRAVVERDRRAGRGGKFGEITDSKHRAVPQRFVNENPPIGLEGFHSPRSGAALVYLARETAPDYPTTAPATEVESGLVVGFSTYAPSAAIAASPRVPTFTVRDPDRIDEATIDLAE